MQRWNLFFVVSSFCLSSLQMTCEVASCLQGMQICRSLNKKEDSFSLFIQPEHTVREICGLQTRFPWKLFYMKECLTRLEDLLLPSLAMATFANPTTILTLKVICMVNRLRLFSHCSGNLRSSKSDAYVFSAFLQINVTFIFAFGFSIHKSYRAA